MSSVYLSTVVPPFWAVTVWVIIFAIMLLIVLKIEKGYNE